MPIREVSLVERKSVAKNQASESIQDGSRGPKPVKEVWRLLEYLMSHGAAVSALWLAEVSMDDILEIVEVRQSSWANHWLITNRLWTPTHLFLRTPLWWSRKRYSTS